MLALHDRLLVDCLGDDGCVDDRIRRFSEMDEAAVALFLDRAFFHGVHTVLYRRLREDGLLARMPLSQQERLQKAVMQYSAFYTGLWHDFRKVQGILGDAGIECIALKGMHLCNQVYRRPTDRTMCDIDLMVRRNDLMRASDLLLQSGMVVGESNHKEGEADYCHHLVPIATRCGGSIELHWTLKRDVPLDLDGLWERSETIAADGMEVRVLSPVDQMLHTVLHGVFPHVEVKLRTLLDLHRLVAYHGGRFDWQVLLQRARAWELENSVLLMLGVIRTVFASPVPEAVFSGRMPDSLKQMEAVAIRCIFSEQAAGRNGAYLFFQLLHAGGFRELYSLVSSKIRYPKEVIASMYAVSEDRPAAGLYVLRIRKLVERFFEAFAQVARASVSGNRDLLLLDKDLNRLENWLSVGRGGEDG